MTTPKITECSITGAGVDRLARALALALDPWGERSDISAVDCFTECPPGDDTTARLVVGGRPSETGGIKHTLPSGITDLDVIAALVQAWLDDLPRGGYGKAPSGDGSTQRGWRVEMKWHTATVHAAWLYIGK